MSTAPHMAFAFGILANILSFLFYLFPLPTFYRIYIQKSTKGFQSMPYLVALFSAMLSLYYAFLKTDNQLMLICINSIGLLLEAAYLIVYIIYAPRPAKINAAKMLLLYMGVYGAIVLSTAFFSERHQRDKVVGWIWVASSINAFAATLSIMGLVVRTESVESVLWPLSFLITVRAVMWLFYGLLIKDFFIAVPNILVFFLGVAEMVLYTLYKDAKKGVVPEFKLQELPNSPVFPALEKTENADRKPNQWKDTDVNEGFGEKSAEKADDSV